jgi:dimethylglycine dehydrogenase
VQAVRTAVGINEVHNFGKFRVYGAGARSWLDRIMAGRIPKPGRLALSPMLSPKGRILGDFTVSCLDDDHFQLTASYGSQDEHLRWFDQNPQTGVLIQNISDRLTGFQIAGPRAQDVLSKVTRSDVSTAAFPFLSVRQLGIGHADCVVQRVSYTGDLGYEIYCDPMQQRDLWDTLWSAGRDLGMRPFGMRAMMSLRLDRLFGSWQREYSRDYTAAETGLDRFVDFTKSTEFIGRQVAEAERDSPPIRKLVAIQIDATDSDPIGYEPVWAADKVVGYCTSGGYSHWLGKTIAFALVPRALDAQQSLQVEILGERRGATLMDGVPFDPAGDRLRG